MAILQVIVILLLVQIGRLQGLSWIYYAGLLCASGFFIYQQKLIFYRDKADCFKAFLNSNWFGFTVFVGLVLEYISLF